MVSFEDACALVADDVVVFLVVFFLVLLLGILLGVLLGIFLLLRLLPYPDGFVVGGTCQPPTGRRISLPLLAIGRPATGGDDIGVALQNAEQAVFVFVVLLLLDEDGIHCPNHDVGI